MIKPIGNNLKHLALALAVAAGLNGGDAQAGTTTTVINLGAPGNGTYFASNALVPEISQGVLPVGSILRSVTLNYTLEGGEPYLGDLAPLFADSNGDNGVLLIAGDPNDTGFPKDATTTVSWNSGGDYSVGATASATLTAADGIPPIDLNSYTVWLQIQGYDGTLSGSVTLEYDVPEAAEILTFGPGAIIDQATKTISWVLPYGSSLTQTPTYTLSSGSCVPDPTVTGIDFSNSVAHPVSYVVTDGGIINEYFVTVTVAGLPDELNVNTYLSRDSASDLDPISNLLAATPSASGTTTARINYHGASFATLPGAPGPDHFTVLWEGWFDVTKDGHGVYTFGTSSDDGSVLYLDLNNDGNFTSPDERIVNNNNYQGDTARTGEVDLEMDSVHMVIGFYQGGGGYDMRAAFKKGSGLGFADLTLINSSSGYFFKDQPGAPPAPSGLVASSWHHSVHLTWSATARATGYQVERLDGSGGSVLFTYTTSDLSYTDTTATTGGPYYYVVRATNAKGAGLPSAEAFASPSPNPIDQTLTFSLGLNLTKTAADALFADTVSPLPSGLSVTYSVPSAEQTVASVNASTGEVTLTGVPGTAHVVANVAANADFNAAEATQTLTVIQATPVITWDNPVPIQIGTLLGGAQLNASSGGVVGGFVYDPPSGTGLALGTHTLSVQFTPSDTVKYSTPAAKTVSLLVIPVESTVIWNVGSGTWDTSTANWKGQSSDLATIFTQGNNAIFSSTSGGTITLVSGMLPASIAVSATSGTYEFSGQPITSGSLTKSGAGTLKIDGLTPNTYTGGTTVNGGLLHLGTMVSGISPLCTGVLGTGPLTLNSGTIEFDRVNESIALIANGGTLNSQNGWGVTWSGPITLNANLTCNTAYGLTYSGAVSGTGGLIKTGNDTLVLSGSNSYTGPTTVTAGKLQCNVTDALGSGDLSISSGAKVNLNHAGTKTVTSLTLGGVAQTVPGTYGSSTSGAAFTNDSYFDSAGSGTVTIASKNDYSAWLNEFTFAAGADTTPTGDPDGDGMTNQQEYAFGLDPTKATSVNPITPLLANGTFTYTRRTSPTATGLTYTVLTSVDLEHWAADTGASQSAVANGAIETVTVTVTATPVNGKLFVRVEASPTP